MAVVMVCLLFALFGWLLGYAAQRFRLEGNPLIEQIDALLPQTQCGQCGFPGCRPYAEAIARGQAEINQCPPGGQACIKALAELLGTEPKPPNARYGVTKPPSVAIIDEASCIGCTLCIQACPVDAILGAPRLMHTVIQSECTGCELCIAPCPVDCIRMVEIKSKGE
jgi:electron transport complex protein RnfB